MLHPNDRLTHEHANGWFSSTGKAAAKYWSNSTKGALIQRLGEYEDIGYTPGELRELLKVLKKYDEVWKE